MRHDKPKATSYTALKAIVDKGAACDGPASSPCGEDVPATIGNRVGRIAANLADAHRVLDDIDSFVFAEGGCDRKDGPCPPPSLEQQIGESAGASAALLSRLARLATRLGAADPR